MFLSLVIPEIAAGIRWRPGIGDPSLAGWATVAAYAIAAGLTVLMYRTCRSDARRLASTRPDEAANQRRLAWFWLLACLTVTALGINKQLDLQSLFTEVLRDLAREQGWYGERRRYQFAFVLGVAGAGVLGVGAMAWGLRRMLGQVWMAILGLGWLTTFVVIRAASFHHVETVLRSLSHSGNVVFELSGIAMVAGGAARSLLSRNRDRPGAGPPHATRPSAAGPDGTP